MRQPHPIFDDPERQHIAVAQALLEADPNLYVTDFVNFGVLQRSLDLVTAFATLLGTRNLTAAIPLLRLQLDSLLRLTYLATLKNADEIAIEILRGRRMSEITDHENKPLTDARLRSHARKHYPWVEKVYAETSRLVHFSDRHVFQSVRGDPDPEVHGGFHIFVGSSPETWPDHLVQEVTDAFAYVTGQILGIIEGWAAHKAKKNSPARARETTRLASS